MNVYRIYIYIYFKCLDKSILYIQKYFAQDIGQNTNCFHR